jgi:hypothetical protein
VLAFNERANSFVRFYVFICIKPVVKLNFTGEVHEVVKLLFRLPAYSCKPWLSNRFLERCSGSACALSVRNDCVRLLSPFDLVLNLGCFVEEFYEVFLFINLPEFGLVDLSLGVALALHHETCLVFDPVVEQIEDEGPNSFKLKRFKMQSQLL